MSNQTWAVATGHPLATDAAVRILRSGGTAIDAGVAAGLTLGVVHPDLVSVAGVAPVILRDGFSGKIVTYDGVGFWPRLADIDLFERDHGGRIPDGILRTVVPAAPAAWLRVLRDHGTLGFADVAADAIRAAEDGFEVYPLFADFIAERREMYGRHASTSDIFLPNGAPPVVGQIFRQTDLARTLRHMVDAETQAKGYRIAGLTAARDAFYRGDIAAEIVAFHKRHGGLLRADDLAAFDVRASPSVPVRFRGLEVHCCGAWCQGISMAQALAMLDASERRPSAHRLIEILKRVFADREAHVTDPDYMRIDPQDLVENDFVASRLATLGNNSDPLPAAGRIASAAASAVSQPALSGAGEEPRGSADTSQVSIIDGAGNMFSSTPSDTSSDTIVIEGTGLSLSSRGSQSRATRDHLNALAPGKRPRLTPNPVLALKDGAPFLSFGTPGGDVQIQAMVQVLLNMLDHGRTLSEAIESPRVSSYAFPGSFAPNDTHANLVMAEADMPTEVIADLRARGHDVRLWEAKTWKAGGICAALQGPDGLQAVADRRRAGTAAVSTDSGAA